jgi:hypothetical protein
MRGRRRVVGGARVCLCRSLRLPPTLNAPVSRRRCFFLLFSTKGTRATPPAELSTTAPAPVDLHRHAAPPENVPVSLPAISADPLPHLEKSPPPLSLAPPVFHFFSSSLARCVGVRSVPLSSLFLPLPSFVPVFSSLSSSSPILPRKMSSSNAAPALAPKVKSYPFWLGGASRSLFPSIARARADQTSPLSSRNFNSSGFVDN